MAQKLSATTCEALDAVSDDGSLADQAVLKATSRRARERRMGEAKGGGARQSQRASVTSTDASLGEEIMNRP